MAIRLSTGLVNKLLGTDDFQTIFNDCVIRCYSGSQPTTPDLAPTGTLLGSITVGGGAFSHGSATNGLAFDNPVGKVISKAAAETWQFKGAATGTLGWFRVQGNAADDNSVSTTLPRLDGTLGSTTSTADGKLSTTSVTATTTITIDTFSITGP